MLHWALTSKFHHYASRTFHNFFKVLRYITKRSTDEAINLNNLTRAGMPPDLNIASRPRLWWERLCSVPAVQRIVSKSFVLLIAWIKALTIGGDIIIACRLASRLDSWWQMVAACPTTTWSSSVSNFVSSGIAHWAIAASSCVNFSQTQHNAIRE